MSVSLCLLILGTSQVSAGEGQRETRPKPPSAPSSEAKRQGTGQGVDKASASRSGKPGDARARGGRKAPTNRGQSDQERAHAAQPIRCDYASIRDQPTDAILIEIRQPGNQVWEHMGYQCGPTGWLYAFFCISNCPEGAPPPIRPTPPEWSFVYSDIEAQAVIPEPSFAPPTQRNGDIAAVIGKRFYFSVSPATFTSFAVERTYTYGFYANALFTPTSISLTTMSGDTTYCDDPIHDITNAAARKLADQQGCYVVFTEQTKSTYTRVRVAVQWRVTLTSNVPFWPTSFTTESFTDEDIPLKQLQAVVVN
jgi:hypothetical protein